MESVQGQRYAMGTFLTVQMSGTDALVLRAALAAFWATVQRLEDLLSIYLPASDISQINNAAGRRPVRVHFDTYRAVAEALQYAAISEGAFDPTVQSLALGAEILSARAGMNYRHVVLDEQARSVFLTAAGMRLDLGGVGKGFALDRALEQACSEPGVKSLFADFGGQLLFWDRSGVFPTETVAIENPDGRGDFLERFTLQENCSVSTSSNAERYFKHWNPALQRVEFCGHLMNPRLHIPARDALSVTVIAPTATEAEAWSTGLFVMAEPERAARLAQAPMIKAFVKTAASFS